MSTRRVNPRLQIGSSLWISDERSTSYQMVESEAEEFTFSARNEMEWLNEHMAEIFNENQVNVAEIFKTPGKLRGKTPRTARKANPLGGRAPLSDVFSATPRAGPSPFRQANYEKPISTFQVAEDHPQSPEPKVLPTKQNSEPTIIDKLAPNYVADSGYFGSQWNDTVQIIEATQPSGPMDTVISPQALSPVPRAIPPSANDTVTSRESDRRTASFQSAKEEQTRNLSEDVTLKPESPRPGPKEAQPPILESTLQERPQESPSPPKLFPKSPTTAGRSPAQNVESEKAVLVNGTAPIEEPHSPSDGSSPIRPIVRKSSLNFASLPAREPITTKKSIGRRISRTSQLEQPRTSYYGGPTGGKILGNIKQDMQHILANDGMDLDETVQEDTDGSQMLRLHSKTSTQRLQDQINMLGKSQSNAWPPSKPTAISGVAQPPVSQPLNDGTQHKSLQQNSPQRRPFVAPGAFPEDEDSWVGASATGTTGQSVFSPRPQMTKSYSADVMEDIREKDSIGGEQFQIQKRGEAQRQMSPFREPIIPDRTTSTLGHLKSASTSVLRSPRKEAEFSEHQKMVSVSNPNPSTDATTSTSPKSTARSQRGSPLKAAKDKFSSILKTSRGLFASSAAVSAEAKTAAMSPATSRIGLHPQPSFEEVLRNSQAYQGQGSLGKNQTSQHVPYSPGKASSRRARESIEREEKRKDEEARETREAKEAQKMADQLEKARQKVKEEAHIYHLEQGRVAAMQKEINARKEEKLVKASQTNTPRATRSSPRKTKAQPEADRAASAAPSTKQLPIKEVEMTDVPALPPSTAAQDIPRPKSQIGRPTTKRPLKPAKEPLAKAKPPTVIRVDTSSQRGQQYHPSNATLAANLHESLAPPSAGSSQGIKTKVSTTSIQRKASTNSFKTAAAKALEAAARKKEQDDIAAQRKQEAKHDAERLRAASRDEERHKEEQERKEEDHQRITVQEREDTANVKTAASRQALEKKRLEVERAKLTGAPPPAIRPQANMDLTLDMLQEKALPQQRGDIVQAQAPRTQPNAYRSYEEHGRSVNSVLHNAAKVPPKRPHPQDAIDESHSRPTTQRNQPPPYNNDTHQPKRRKTSETIDSHNDNMTESQPKMTAPPIRQSTVRQKDVPTKSIFPSGYANAPPAGNIQRATLIAQHNQSKPAHPMDMAQISKAPIPFATSSGQGNTQHKTPARPGQPPQGTKGKSTVKSAAKSSPRYQNGDSIELPEINTDSEDDDSDAGNDFVALPWTNSPDLRKQLAKQETIDPAEVFGQPGPLNMEEVFSKSKDRFHKFRARTSSANWSGSDRLTEEEVRRDMEARDRVRRQGGWTYDSMV